MTSAPRIEPSALPSRGRAELESRRSAVELDPVTGEPRPDAPRYQLPHGPRHYYAALHDTAESRPDRRQIFQPLQHIRHST